MSDFEARLSELRRTATAAPRPQQPSGYYGRPMVKPPVWTWEIPLYFFVGGVSGMSATLALGSLAGNAPLAFTRAALWLSVAGALISPVLLILDLGRPSRFLNMLRVFKWRSAMSVGAWTLVVHSTLCVSSLMVFELFRFAAVDVGLPKEGVAALLFALLLTSAVTGTVLATYTGVLLGATAIPVWYRHRSLLPVHFGAASLGSAAALLELLGHSLPALHTVGMVVALVETVVFALTEVSGHAVVDRPLRSGRTGLMIRSAGALTGPIALALRFADVRELAAIAFVTGALLARYAWMAAGRASALDPEATIAAQGASGNNCVARASRPK